VTYLSLSLLFLAASLVVGVIAVARRGSGTGADRSGRSGGPGRRATLVRWLPAVAIAGVAIMILTGVFDNLMIGSGLMTYGGTQISGILVGVAPLEDFAYPLAGLILLPSVWSLTGGSRERGSRERESRERASREH
jgi:lycopene cyclase domain-containing protein